jgi:deoxyribodipyrimidine photo-lyase
VSGLTVHPPAYLHKPNGTPYTVFTPYSKAWKNMSQPSPEAILPAPAHISTPAHLIGVPLLGEPVLPTTVPFPPGETEAQRRLRQFTGEACPINEYADRRNRLDLEGTSQLSPYLRLGMLSARQAVVQAIAAIEHAPTALARQGAETWLNELIWREFFISLLAHFPQTHTSSFRPEYDRIRWLNDEAAFTAWTEGRTGYPAVDAAMRQLVYSGWMHNRARMLVASFLVKDLLIDWRWGARFFMQHLLDGDPAVNIGGWQWTAGVGADAAPYFRVFNPILQGQKFDPNGVYIRRWLPELAQIPNRYIHNPWDMPLAIQRQAGCLLDQDYPKPIIDHHWARERTLTAYAQIKEPNYV